MEIYKYCVKDPHNFLQINYSLAERASGERILAMAEERGIAMTKDEGRELFYGMPYGDWVAAHQTEADPAKQAAFPEAVERHGG